MEQLPETRDIVCLHTTPVVLEAFTRMFNEQPDLNVSWTGTSPALAWKAIEAQRPDLFILDMSLHGIDVLTYIKNIHLVWPKLGIVALSDEDPRYAQPVIRCGAKAYLTKYESPDAIMHAVRQVLNGQTIVSEKIKNP